MDLQQIEKISRALADETRLAIYQAIARIIHKITAQDAKAWFRLPLHAV